MLKYAKSFTPVLLALIAALMDAGVLTPESVAAVQDAIGRGTMTLIAIANAAGVYLPPNKGGYDGKSW